MNKAIYEALIYIIENMPDYEAYDAMGERSEAGRIIDNLYGEMND